LTVIIPCLNAEGTIADQLEALANQRWSHPWELIISDNGSTDGTAAIVNAFRDRLPHLRVVDASGLHRQSHALNVGARAAAAELLAFCDADDEVGPGWVAAMGDGLFEHDVVHGEICYDKFNGAAEAVQFARMWERGLHRKQFLPHAGAGNLGVRRAAHEAIGGFDEHLPRFADGDYCWRLQLSGYKLHYEPKAVLQCRVGRVNQSLPYLFRRGWTAPAADYWTYKKYRSIGVTKNGILPAHRTMRRSLRAWVDTLRNAPRQILAGGREGRAAWLRGFVTQSGEVYGQLLGRLTNPCEPLPSDGRFVLPIRPGSASASAERGTR